MSEKPQQDSARKTGKQKRKGSSFYVYLVILFGAAFLMLLLAYFIQQRSSETAFNDLRNSMTLSRDELLEDIQRLEAENGALQAERDAQAGRLAELEQENTRLAAQLDGSQGQLLDYTNRVAVLTDMAILEQAVRDQDYELAAQKVRLLCTGELNLDLGIMDLEGRQHFDPQERLAELIPLLETHGALAEGEVTLP